VTKKETEEFCYIQTGLLTGESLGVKFLAKGLQGNNGKVTIRSGTPTKGFIIVRHEEGSKAKRPKDLVGVLCGTNWEEVS